MLVERAEFLRTVGQTLGRASGEAKVALLFLNVDHFEVVNDTLGPRIGQRVLKIIGERIGGCLRPGDVLGKLRGDEFAVMLPPAARAEEAAVLAERVAECLRVPLSVGEQQLTLTTSIGVALSEPDDTASTLLRNADIAMCQAKDRGRGNYRIFDPGMRRRAWERMRLETELRQALDRDEFVVHYQPIVDLRSRRLVGAEALVRWAHPQRGLVPPSEFIPVAEETGVIVEIGRVVLEKACAQAARWQAGPLARPSVSINVSARQLEDADRLIASIDTALRRTGLDPTRLKVEITESAVMRDPELAIAILWALKGKGVRVAVDDFGTGYSSLAYLKRFPIDMIKIDRSFVDGVAYLPEDQAIVGATVAFARALDMAVVAEGVEDDDQAQMLQDLGCDLGQGYLWGRPAPAAALSNLIGTSPQLVVPNRAQRDLPKAA